MNVSKFQPGTHFLLLFHPITLKHAHSTVHKESGLTVAPSRSSPEAETCREPRRCGWSGPPLSSESEEETGREQRWRLLFVCLSGAGPVKKMMKKLKES